MQLGTRLHEPPLSLVAKKQENGLEIGRSGACLKHTTVRGVTANALFIFLAQAPYLAENPPVQGIWPARIAMIAPESGESGTAEAPYVLRDP